MKASDIRQKFLDYFERNGHSVRPSSSLVPQDDPTLLFTNAGMVQFKRVFLGEEQASFRRATTSQKCLRVSGKHNDLEEVGVTPRHHTFFEMLGNFSFGDYFKREAIAFAWELVTRELGLEPDRMWATVHHSDDEAFALWQEVAGLPASRIFRLGDKDNFWQMGETGPCGPCSELHYDRRPASELGKPLDVEAFVALTERSEILEFWNLVFMQYDRGADGELTPLPAPSIDTGMGLERLAALLQGVDSNYETDLFTPLIERAAEVVGKPYDAAAQSGVSYRVLADHARATAFLMADGVFPTNEGRGYVLRRIMRRAVRHAWLLGRREPTLVEVVDRVVDTMGDAYPELRERREHLLRATRTEEERFLETIDTGMERIEELAPALAPQQRAAIDEGVRPRPTVSGADAFRLYDTFGFPLDLTALIARERGYDVDVEGFDAALEEQRERSRADRRAAGIELEADALSEGWEELAPEAEQEFVGYASTEVETDIIAFRREDGRLALQLRENPFYAEAGGQVSDRGEVSGDGWRMEIDAVRRVAGRVAVLGAVEGDFPGGGAPIRARAAVAQPTRHDTERNHTATHLLHAALRKVLGTHVLQRGSLVAPDRLRFDFSHPQPLTPEEIRRVEDEVNRAILADEDVCIDYMGYPEAVARGAMALFGEKYGDIVRVIEVPGVSMELCGGTHVRHTGEIGLFRIVGETGVASGVRRIEAVTGTAAYRRTIEQDELLREAASLLKTAPENLVRRIEQLVEEKRALERQLERARAAGAADMVGRLLEGAAPVDGARVVATEVDVASADELRALGDRLRERLGSGAAVLAARFPEKTALFAVVTDDLVSKGVRADRLVREVAQMTGGSGGGRPHMAQGGVGDPGKVGAALGRASDIVREMLGHG
ncbi:MAG TPA: alanine--tRNA ligase [Longimicrobiales bacterium]